MPFKSKAQRRKFAELLVKGEISGEVYERWNRDTGRSALPEHVGAKKSRASKRGKTAKTKAGAKPKVKPARKSSRKSTRARK